MKTSKKILGATLALSLIIPSSGCGGSKYAVKGCKQQKTFLVFPLTKTTLRNLKYKKMLMIMLI